MALAQVTNDWSGFASRGKHVLATHPGVEAGARQQALEACFEACADCAQACIACADACLGEANVADLVTCIRLNQDCADLCEATGNILSRQVSLDWDIASVSIRACTIACQKCAEECERHAEHMEHCRECAQACRACQRACDVLTQHQARNQEWDLAF
jgi:hypothetical protein